MNKCVCIIGPESSGSKLIARICSHVLGISQFNEWNGTGWSNNGLHKVIHRSLPYDIPPKFPDVDEWISANTGKFEIYFILTTRDISISEISRFQRWGKPLHQSREETSVAREIMISVLHKNVNCFIWSYESFMFLGKEYLKSLYSFLGVESEFMPIIIDGNKSKVVGIEGVV